MEKWVKDTARHGRNLSVYLATSAARCWSHFGLDDPMIFTSARDVLKDSGRPTDQCFECEGVGHAFANAVRPSFREQAAELAQRRTLDFSQQAFVGGGAK